MVEIEREGGECRVRVYVCVSVLNAKLTADFIGPFASEQSKENEVGFAVDAFSPLLWTIR